MFHMKNLVDPGLLKPPQGYRPANSASPPRPEAQAPEIDAIMPATGPVGYYAPPAAKAIPAPPPDADRLAAIEAQLAEIIGYLGELALGLTELLRRVGGA
jgi:hypothetical protein